MSLSVLNSEVFLLRWKTKFLSYKSGIPLVKNDTDLLLKCTTSKQLKSCIIFRKAVVAIVVFDVTSQDTFEKSQHW